MPTQRPGPGVGVLFNPALIDFVDQHAHALDHLAVIPDRCWVDEGPGARAGMATPAPGARRFQPLPAPLALIDRAAAKRPVVLHSIGLSICSAEVFDTDYVHNLARWAQHWRSRWVSEHLSFSRAAAVPGAGAGGVQSGAHEVNAALALPIAYDEEMLDLLVPRIDAVQQRLGVPFLLENNVAYVQLPEQGMGEAEFLNRLCARTHCGLLLDLHNLYTNAVNHRFSAYAFLDQLDLSSVVEVHVAGGEPMMGFHTDSHTGAVHEGVWPLLAAMASRATALQAVTFEFHESSWPQLHTAGVLAQLNQAREVLAQAAANRAFDEEVGALQLH